MATIPTSHYFTPTETVTAATMNVVRDHFTWAKSMPTCRLGLASTSVSVPHNTWTLMDLDWQELDDTDGMHNTGANVYAITFNTPGVYEISVNAVWQPLFSTYSAASTNCQWSTLIALNNAGSSVNLGTNSWTQDTRIMSNVGFTGDTLDTMSLGFTDYFVTNGGDTLEMWVRQFTTGGTINIEGNGATGRAHGSATTFSAKLVSIL